MTAILFRSALFALVLAGITLSAPAAYAVETAVDPWGPRGNAVIIRTGGAGGGIYHTLPADGATEYSLKGPCTVKVYIRQVAEDYESELEEANIAVFLDNHRIATIANYEDPIQNAEPVTSGVGGATIGIPTEFAAGVYTVREGSHTLKLVVDRAEDMVVARVTYEVTPPPPAPAPVVVAAPPPAPASPPAVATPPPPTYSPEVRAAVRQVLDEHGTDPPEPEAEKAPKPPKAKEPKPAKPAREPVELAVGTWHLAALTSLDPYGPSVGLLAGGMVSGPPQLSLRFAGGLAFTGDSNGEQALNQWNAGGFSPSLVLSGSLLLDPTKPPPPAPPSGPGGVSLPAGAINFPEVLLVPGGLQYRLLRVSSAPQHELAVPLGAFVDLNGWSVGLLTTPGLYWGNVPEGEWIECQDGQYCPGPGTFPPRLKLGLELQLLALP
jgi:hypothetical protein